MKADLFRRVKRIERELPPIQKPVDHPFSLDSGFVVYKGIRFTIDAFLLMFPNSTLNNIDFETEAKEIEYALRIEKTLDRCEKALGVEKPPDERVKVFRSNEEYKLWQEEEASKVVLPSAETARKQFIEKYYYPLLLAEKQRLDAKRLINKKQPDFETILALYEKEVKRPINVKK